MLTFSCQSGSNGNCIFVQAGRTRILVDAGISGLCARRRLEVHGQDIRKVDAVLLSHDHIDHVRAAGIFQRKFGLPIYVTQPTFSACRHLLGPVTDVRHFRAGERFEVGELTVQTIPTPHDGADGVCFALEHAGRRLGVLTDLGFVFPELEDLVGSLDGAYLESNYDPDMLRTGPYPPHLKARIVGDGGHISNAQAGELLRDFTDGRLKWACLAHLSEMNNTPELALSTGAAYVGPRVPLHLAGRYEASRAMEL